MAGETAIGWIEGKKDYLADINDRIWRFAEVGLQEYKSAKLLADELESAGFKVERGVAGMPTAFVATWGAGKPKIGFLAEYDALPHLSQKAVPYKEALTPDAPGHGCGHNSYGTGVLGAVLGLKEEMIKDNLKGTIAYFGCPAEETLIGKVFMARAGLYDDLDCCFTWHPGPYNNAKMGSSNAMNSAKFSFKGISAHAAGDPENGRSALDAVELMNVGVNFLREHVIQDARLHYVITKGGGEPNVVPPDAQVWYYVRAPRRQDVDEIFERVVKIAKAAADMTETTMSMEILSGCYNILPNEVLANVMQEALLQVGPPIWSDEEIEFAKEMTKSLKPGQKERILRAAGLPKEYNDKYLDDTISPIIDRGLAGKGSSDVADCSWITPTAQISAVGRILGSPGHSWQIVATSGMSIAHKGLVLAAKAMAISASRCFRDTKIIDEAKEEFDMAREGKVYKCAIPDDVAPPLDQLGEQVAQG